jgi:hypothetical protein
MAQKLRLTGSDVTGYSHESLPGINPVVGGRPGLLVTAARGEKNGSGLISNGLPVRLKKDVLMLNPSYKRKSLSKKTERRES